MSLIEKTTACRTTLGSRCRSRIRQVGRPLARAAMAYSCSLATSTSPRTMRQYATQPTSVIAM